MNVSQVSSNLPSLVAIVSGIGGVGTPAVVALGSIAIIVVAGFVPAQATGTIRAGLLVAATATVVVSIALAVGSLFPAVLELHLHKSTIVRLFLQYTAGFVSSGVVPSIVYAEHPVPDIFSLSIGVVPFLVLGIPFAVLGRWVFRRNMRAAVPTAVGSSVNGAAEMTLGRRR